MDFHKLKLEKFTTYNGINIPIDFDPGLKLDDKPEVYFMFAKNIQDLMNAINIVQNNQKHIHNRVFFVFKKGNKAFNRDHLYNVVSKHKDMKRKAPILASLDKTYSVFCFELNNL